MRTIALTLLRVVPVFAWLALCMAPAMAQAPPPVPAAAPAAGAASAPGPAAAPEAPQAIIRHIQVVGTQRIEPATVLSYITLREGDVFDPAQEDAAVKALFATNLFSDVKTSFDGSIFAVRVVENPIVNQVVFEGNNKVSSKDLTKEVQIKPRSIFTRSKVQSDVQRIVELYRRAGKFAASVDPQIIQRPQNRVDLIFSISEGPTTGVSRINFVGNKVFDDDTLRGQIATEESAWYKFLASNDNYDPDRLTFDREQLRRYYNNHGYADFNVVSAVAELTPDRRSFYITFTVSEGDRYKISKVDIESKIKDLTAAQLRPSVTLTAGDTYNADLMESSIDALTNAAGTKGYAFAEVHPRLQRDRVHHTIDVTFQVDEGPRVYIEKINIVGNTRTLDKVIRREFRLVEGDAFNRVLVDRSRTRIRGLGFFSDVNVKESPGTQPDRTDLTVTVAEQSTGSVAIGAGYSSTSQLVGEFSYTQQNMFGRGEFMQASLQASQISKQFQFSFTEPWFLDRPLAAGFDLYKVVSDLQQVSYESDTTAGILRFGFPISEFSNVSLNFTYKLQRILPYQNAPATIVAAAGKTKGSIIGFGYGYNTLDDQRKPTTGLAFSFGESFAGFGGNLKYLKSESQFAVYHPFFNENIVGSLSGNAGIINAYDGTVLPVNERFFKGADSFRGFAIAGVGPRDLAVPKDYNAIGGNVYAIGTFTARLPKLLPESYGINLALFSDFGTVGHLDLPSRICSVATCVKDNLAFRASAGISFGWKSPFGPIQIALGIPIAKTDYDRSQIIYFSSGTGF